MNIETPRESELFNETLNTTTLNDQDDYLDYDDSSSSSATIFDQIDQYKNKFNSNQNELVENLGKLTEQDDLFKRLNIKTTLIELNQSFLLEILDKLDRKIKQFKIPKRSFYVRIFFPSLVLSTILVIYINYYLKCSFSFIDSPLSNDTIYLTSFSKSNISIYIPYCSCLYQDGKFGLKYTQLGWLFNFVKIYYLAYEIRVLISLDVKKILRNSRLFCHDRIKKSIKEYSNKFCINFLSTLSWIFVFIITYLITQLFYIIFYILIEIVFLAISFLTNQNQHLFFVKQLKEIFSVKVFNILECNNSILIQIFTLYSILTLNERLKVIDLFGLLIIRRTSIVFERLFQIIIFVLPLFNKLVPALVDDIDKSNLTIFIDQQEESIKLSNLTEEFKDLFYYELNNYVYYNSKINLVFPIILLLYLIYLIFIGLNLIYEKYGVYNSSLEFEKIHQKLIIYEYIRNKNKPGLIARCCGTMNKKTQASNENLEEKRKLKRRHLNIMWKPCFFIYKLIIYPSEIDMIMERIRKICETNQYLKDDDDDDWSKMAEQGDLNMNMKIFERDVEVGSLSIQNENEFFIEMMDHDDQELILNDDELKEFDLIKQRYPYLNDIQDLVYNPKKVYLINESIKPNVNNNNNNK